MRSRFVAALCVAAVASAGGCASQKKPDGDARASSLVYSPAERLPPDRDDRPSHAADSSTTSVASQEDPVRPPAGWKCRIHFRREAMGVAGQAPYPLSGNNLATDRAQITGTLERVGRDWLVVRGDRSTYWIPREAVLAVEFAEQQ
jgi:hypothetical protein